MSQKLFMRISLNVLKSIQLSAALIFLLGGSSLYAADPCSKFVGGKVTFPCEVTDRDDKARKYTLKGYLDQGAVKYIFTTESGQVLAINMGTDEGKHKPSDKPLKAEYEEVALIDKLAGLGYPMITCKKAGRFDCFTVKNRATTYANTEEGGCTGYPMKRYEGYKHYKVGFPHISKFMKDQKAFTRFQKTAIAILTTQKKAKKVISDFQYFANLKTGEILINDPMGYVDSSNLTVKAQWGNILEDLHALPLLKFGQSVSERNKILEKSAKISKDVVYSEPDPLASMKTIVQKALKEGKQLHYILQGKYDGHMIMPVKLTGNILKNTFFGFENEDLDLTKVRKLNIVNP
ncbi:MAG: hypothetical protein GY754_09090 [bacterium]|nr:hypothetical protein [bacterium]